MTTTDHMERLNSLAHIAAQAKQQKCVNCETYVFYFIDTEARVSGHIYQIRYWVKEFKRLRICQHCFDAARVDEPNLIFYGTPGTGKTVYRESALPLRNDIDYIERAMTWLEGHGH